MHHQVPLKPFTTPNFVIAERPPRGRSSMTESMEEPKFALAELSSETLSELCEQFRVDVFKKAGKPLPPKP